MTTTLQPFRVNDTIEPKYRDSALGALQTTETDLDTFWSEAFQAAPLGDVIYALGRDPMTNGVLTPEVYRASFWAIHQIFTRPGTFEFYLDVFRAIWGDDVDVEFVIPAPGKLQINIGEITIEDFNLAFRRIVADVYFYDDAITTDGGPDEILAQDTVGTKSQSEVDALISEISMAGIVTIATLTL